MPDGLKYLLGAPGRQQFVTILENDETCLHRLDYLRELINNFVNEGRKRVERKIHVHLLLYKVSKDTLQSGTGDGMLMVYDDLVQMTVGQIYESLMKNVNGLGERDCDHVLVVDDFSLFSLLSANRDCSRLEQFLRKCKRVFHRCFIFVNQSTLMVQEVGKLYDVSSAVAVLGNPLAPLKMTQLDSSLQKMMTCDLLKIRDERGISHEQTRFQIVDGEISEMEHGNVTGGGGKDQEELLKNLTTFKLTVEDKEKESRSKLYLPYFDAQKVQVEEPEDLDDYDDEDDEV